MTKGLFTKLFRTRSAFAGCVTGLFLFITAVAVLLSVSAYQSAVTAVVQANDTRATLLAELVQEYTRAALLSVQREAANANIVAAVQSKNFLEALESLARLTGTHPEIESAFLSNPDGTLWANSPVDESTYGKDFSYRDWYQGVSIHWTPYISNAYQRRAWDGALAIALAVPVRDKDDQVIGILAASQSPNYFVRLVRRIDPQPGQRITLIDREGMMFYSDRFPELKELLPYPALSHLPEIIGEDHVTLELEDSSEDDRAKFVSCAVVPGIGWKVVVEHAKMDALRPEVAHISLVAAVALLVFVALTALLMHFRGKYQQLEAMRRLNDHLEDRVQERTVELREANKALEQEIVERRRVEQQLRELSQRLTYHVDHSPLAVIEWGEDLRLTRWSGEAERIFGWKTEEVIGKRKEDFPWIHPEDEFQVAQVSTSIRRGEHPHRLSVNRNYRKDGSIAFCEWYNSALLDSNGKVKSVLSLVLDVTERVQAEEGLRQAQASLQAHAEELEKIVARRTAKLQETIAELEHFSYAITHDMRAPLRAMQGFADLMQEEFENGVNRELCLDFLRRIKTASMRMDQLIIDTLNYSKAVRQELPTGPVDLTELLHGLVDTYPNLQPDKADIRIEGQFPRVMANEAALTQCFSNLLGNAVKFVRRDQKAQIRVWCEPVSRGGGPASPPNTSGGGEKSFVRVWVEDNGIGVSPAFQPRIFQMFQRGTKEYEGTGIGLAIVRKVVQRIGGEVGLVSTENQGSRFWVDLVQVENPTLKEGI